MDFAWFILAEEDKSSPASIDLWFSCIDRDEDGYWSPQDIHSFYEEQLFRMEFSALDIVPFEDALVQIIDMVKPEDPSRITLAEIRNSGFATDVFDLLFNLHKFLSHDRALSLDGSVGMEPVPLASWESFASTEYLIALGETPYGDESDEWDDENLDIWVEVATEPADSEAASSSMTSSAGVITPRDVQV
jgi:serine/threonine-protein phosphatase 2A regulatory subunit B''